MPELQIVKVGGSLINDQALLESFLTAFSQLKGSKILVHGGGKKATSLCKKLGIKTQLINGRRITDNETLEVAIMVYAGLVNKTIVAQLQARNLNALGLCGADLNLIQAHKRKTTDIDYGMVGDVDHINDVALLKLLEQNFTPIIAPISHDKAGQLLNTNADTIAGAVSVAMAAHYTVTLKYCFEFPGVMRDINTDIKPIPRINSTIYKNLQEEGVVHSGMLPKIDNAIAAAETVHQVAICGIDNLVNEKDLTWIG